MVNALLELSDTLKSINDLVERDVVDELKIFAEEAVRCLVSHEHIFAREDETCSGFFFLEFTFLGVLGPFSLVWLELT